MTVNEPAVKNTGKSNIKNGGKNLNRALKSSETENPSLAKAYIDISKKFDECDYKNAELLLEKYLKKYPSNLFLIELVFTYAGYIENGELMKSACGKSSLMPETASTNADFYNIWHSKNVFNGKINKRNRLNGENKQ